LTMQAGKQVPAEAEAEVLEELEEDMDHREEIVKALGQALKDAVPEGLKGRVEEAMKESVSVAAKGRRYVDHIRARLDFSKDSESSGSRAATGGAPGGWRTAAEELGEELREEFEEEAEDVGRPAGNFGAGDTTERDATGTGGAAPRYLMEFMRSFGQMRANDNGWPTFNGRYVSYPRFKKEWVAYQLTYHSAVSDDLAARTLRDKCLQGEALQMVSHLDDLHEMWETLDTCYERPGKYAEEALKPIVDFRRYKVINSAAVREFYSLVRAAIKGARKIGRIELLLNDQTIPQIMGKMPPADWKEWATKGPDWAGQDATLAFEDFIERKWLDVLNIAVTEPAPWRGEGEKVVRRVRTPDKVSGDEKGVMKLTGAVNTVERGEFPRSPSPQWSLSFKKKCRARNLIGCDGNHVMLQCEKLLSLGSTERREVMERSGLCTFCLKHSAELECYGRGGLSKPKCTRPGCDGEHTPGVHSLMGKDDAEVNLVAGDGDEAGEEGEAVGEYEYEYEDEHEDRYEYECEYEGLWVGTIGATEMPERTNGSSGITAVRGPAQGDDQAKMKGGDRIEQDHDFQVGECSEGEMAGDEQWELETDHPGCRAEGTRDPPHGPSRHLPGGRAWLPHVADADRPRVRGRSRAAPDRQWEEVRHNAWLRQLLSDDSSDEDEDEDEERYGRFAESGRWMTELYGIPQHPAATSGRECSA
jgi:hypothetical protein